MRTDPSQPADAPTPTRMGLAPAAARRPRIPGEPWLFWLLTALMLNQASSNLVRPMVSYRALEVGVDPANLGLLSAVFSVAPLLIALRIGRMLDRRGEMRFIVWGNVVMVATVVALAASSSALAVFALFGIFGLGHFMAAFATQPLLARFSHAGNFDQRFAAYSFAASVGQMLGPALGGVVAGGGSSEEITRALLLGAFIGVAVIGALLLVRLPGPSRPVPASPISGGAPADETRVPLTAILTMPDVTRAILVSATVLSAIDIVVIYLPALGEERAWSATVVGTLLAVRAGSSMAMRLGLGWLAARFSRRLLLMTSMALSAIALLAVPFTDSIPVTAVLMAAAGAGLGVGQPMTMAWVAALAPPGIRATLLSVRVMGNGVGEVVLPVLAGTMAVVAGAGGVLGATGALIVGSIVLGFAGQRPSGSASERR